MQYLLDWRLWVVSVLLALGPIGYLKGRGDGRKLERLELAAAKRTADAEALALERRRQDRADEAARLAAAREAVLRADAAHARDAAGGLRDAAELAERAAAESGAAAVAARRAFRVVVGECGARLGEVAGDADLARSEARELREAWPR